MGSGEVPPEFEKGNENAGQEGLEEVKPHYSSLNISVLKSDSSSKIGNGFVVASGQQLSAAGEEPRGKSETSGVEGGRGTGICWNSQGTQR